MSLVISNIDTCFLPPKTALSFSSASIMRLFSSFCSLNFLMYSQIFLVTSVRGSGLAPTTAARTADGVIAFMKAAFGLRGVAGLAAFFAAGLAAALGAAAFFAAGFAAGLAAAFAAGLAAGLAAGFFAAGFAAGLAAGFAAAFFAGAAAFAAGFLAAAAGFFAAGFFAAGFAAGFLAVAIFKPPSQMCWEYCVMHAPLIVVRFLWRCKCFFHVDESICGASATRFPSGVRAEG